MVFVNALEFKAVELEETVELAARLVIAATPDDKSELAIVDELRESIVAVLFKETVELATELVIAATLDDKLELAIEDGLREFIATVSLEETVELATELVLAAVLDETVEPGIVDAIADEEVEVGLSIRIGQLYFPLRSDCLDWDRTQSCEVQGRPRPSKWLFSSQEDNLSN